MYTDSRHRFVQICNHNNEIRVQVHDAHGAAGRCVTWVTVAAVGR